MRVAYVIDSLGHGGAQRQAVEIASRLAQEPDVDVRFAVYRDIGFFQPRLEAAGISAERIPKFGPLDAGFPGRIRRWLVAQQPDVAHVFLPIPTIWTAFALRGYPTPAPVFIAAERSALDENVTGPLAWLLRRAYAAFDAVTANSRPAAAALVSSYGLAPERVHYLPNGIDLAEWDRRAAEPPPFELEPGFFHLAQVGRVAEEKNHRLLLDALARLPEDLRARLRCWFLGAEDGKPHFIEAVRREVAHHGLAEAIRMLPPTPALPALMSRLDGLVLPSRYEGFPNVVLEAMATRLPVVASAVGDVPALLSEGRGGFMVPAGDAAALADALAKLIRLGPGARAEMGAAGRAVVEERFRIEDVARAHLALYRRLAHGLPDEGGRPGGDARAGGLG